MADRTDLPPLLGTKWKTSDNFDAIAYTPIGAAIITTTGQGTAVLLDVADRWMEVTCGGDSNEAIAEADRRLRALCSAAVEPAALEIDRRVRNAKRAAESGNADANAEFNRMDAYAHAAELVRTHYEDDHG